MIWLFLVALVIHFKVGSALLRYMDEYRDQPVIGWILLLFVWWPSFALLILLPNGVVITFFILLWILCWSNFDAAFDWMFWESSGIDKSKIDDPDSYRRERERRW
jgi:hypothetical protein